VDDGSEWLGARSVARCNGVKAGNLREYDDVSITPFFLIVEIYQVQRSGLWSRDGSKGHMPDMVYMPLFF